MSQSPFTFKMVLDQYVDQDSTGIKAAQACHHSCAIGHKGLGLYLEASCRKARKESTELS